MEKCELLKGLEKLVDGRSGLELYAEILLLTSPLRDPVHEELNKSFLDCLGRTLEFLGHKNEVNFRYRTLEKLGIRTGTEDAKGFLTQLIKTLQLEWGLTGDINPPDYFAITRDLAG